MRYEPRWRRLQVRRRGDSGESRNRASEVLAAMVAQPRVMRVIPRLLTAAGLDLCWSRGYLVADIGRADFFAAAVASFRVLLPARCPDGGYRPRGRRLGRWALLLCEQLLDLTRSACRARSIKVLYR